MIFTDRYEAGRLLADKLDRYRNRENTLVFALPKGGVPVAYELAGILRLPLDVFVVRKLPAPADPNVTIGAIAPNETRILNTDLINQLDIPLSDLKQIIQTEKQHLERLLLLYRGESAYPDLKGKTVILVDDGMATGSTALTAVKALQKMRPGCIALAQPVGSNEAVSVLREEVSDLVCLHIPVPFLDLSSCYKDYPAVSTRDVVNLLHVALKPV